MSRSSSILATCSLIYGEANPVLAQQSLLHIGRGKCKSSTVPKTLRCRFFPHIQHLILPGMHVCLRLQHLPSLTKLSIDCMGPGDSISTDICEDSIPVITMYISGVGDHTLIRHWFAYLHRQKQIYKHDRSTLSATEYNCMKTWKAIQSAGRSSINITKTIRVAYKFSTPGNRSKCVEVVVVSGTVIMLLGERTDKTHSSSNST